jgi:AcrR family transcriptional regulator
MPESQRTTAGRRLTPKGEATRARLVDLAGAVFAEQGYATASVRDIARRSGLSSGAIYGAFSGKAELLAEAVDARIRAEIDTVPAPVLDRSLPEIDAFQFAHAPERNELRVLLLEAACAARTDPLVRDRMRDALGARIDLATDAHEEWRERSGVGADLDMRTVVLLLWAADLGLAILEANGIDPPDPEAWSALVLRMLTSLEASGAEPGAPSPRPLP